MASPPPKHCSEVPDVPCQPGQGHFEHASQPALRSLRISRANPQALRPTGKMHRRARNWHGSICSPPRTPGCRSLPLLQHRRSCALLQGRKPHRTQGRPAPCFRGDARRIVLPGTQVCTSLAASHRRAQNRQVRMPLPCTRWLACPAKTLAQATSTALPACSSSPTLHPPCQLRGGLASPLNASLPVSFLPSSLRLAWPALAWPPFPSSSSSSTQHPCSFLAMLSQTGTALNRSRATLPPSLPAGHAQAQPLCLPRRRVQLSCQRDTHLPAAVGGGRRELLCQLIESGPFN